MNEYAKIVARITEMRANNEHVDAISIMAFAATLGVDVDIGFMHIRRKGYSVRARLSRKDHPKHITFEQSEIHVTTNSFMRYADNQIVNNTVVDAIQEAARKRRNL